MSDKKREDKIYGNSWNSGDNLKGSDYKFSRTIKVADDYSNSYLKHIYNYEDHLEYKIILDEILKTIDEDKELHDIFYKPVEGKRKFSNDQINFIFDRIYETIRKNTQDSKFLNPIYVVEAISSITKFDYKKIFDLLDYKYQEILINELDKHYKFLDGNTNNLH